jgi:hypothetical protein
MLDMNSGNWIDPVVSAKQPEPSSRRVAPQMR